MSWRWITLAGWSILAAVIVAAEMVAHTVGRRLQGFEVIMVVLARSRATRVALLLGWGWLGWHLFVR